jgi:large subunit ribosomal protein L17
VPHQVHQRKFGRQTGHRKGMLRNLTLSVLRYERVKTTEAKAKEVRRFVDKMIDLGKDGSLAARRRAAAWLPEPAIVEKLFTDLAKRYPDRSSGYVRVAHLGRRVGDSAPMMLLELMPGVEAQKAAADAAAEEAKPRRRLPSLRRAPKTEEPAAEAEPAKKPVAKKTTTKKKTAKGTA